MKEYKLKGIAIKDYNDKIRGVKVEEGEDVIEDRTRYEELYAGGFVSDGTVVEEKTKKFFDDIKDEDK